MTDAFHDVISDMVDGLFQQHAEPFDGYRTFHVNGHLLNLSASDMRSLADDWGVPLPPGWR